MGRAPVEAAMDSASLCSGESRVSAELDAPIGGVASRRGTELQSSGSFFVDNENRNFHI